VAGTQATAVDEERIGMAFDAMPTALAAGNPDSFEY
jgi:hypothetical protein